MMQGPSERRKRAEEKAPEVHTPPVSQKDAGAAAVQQVAEQGKAPEEGRSALRNVVAKAVEDARAAVFARKQAAGGEMLVASQEVDAGEMFMEEET